MDLQRAQQIVNADVFVNVHYHGIPVYIQKVDEGKAQVFPLDAMDQEQEVDIEGLSENGPIFI